jgi:Predicted membrane protein (DUF2157)
VTTTVPATGSRPDRDDDLGRRLADWVDRGLITSEQAARIRDVEEERPGGPAPRTASALRPGSLVGEALGYVGGVLVVVAAGLIAGRYWPGLGTGSRLGIAFGAAAVLLVAGAAAPARRGAGLRLRSVTWLLSTAAVAAGLALLGDEALRLDGDDTALLAAGGAAAWGAVLWWRHRGFLQHAAVVAALAVSAGVLAAHLPVADGRVSGVAVWGVGTVWLVLGRGGVFGRSQPASAFGAVVAVVGAQLTVDRWWGAVLALATVAALVAVAAAGHDLVLLAVGAVGALTTVPAVLTQYFPDTLTAPLALLATGILLVGCAPAVTGRRARARPAVAPVDHRRKAIGLAAAVAVGVLAAVLALGLGGPIT